MVRRVCAINFPTILVVRTKALIDNLNVWEMCSTASLNPSVLYYKIKKISARTLNPFIGLKLKPSFQALKFTPGSNKDQFWNF